MSTPTTEQLMEWCREIDRGGGVTLALLREISIAARALLERLERLEREREQRQREPRRHHTINCASVTRKGTSIMCDCGAVQIAGDP